MSPPVMITREMWSGKSFVTWETGNLELPVKRVFFGITFSDMCFTVASCINVIYQIKEKERLSQERKGRDPDVAYNFMIGGDGCVYEGRGWNTSPRVPKIYKKFTHKSILIAFIGNFRRHPPSFKMFDARDDLIQYGIENDYIDKQYLPCDILR